MRILVTGGTGYIGSHTVVELQNAGYEVLIIDNLSNSNEEVVNRIEKISGIKPAFENIDLCDGPKMKKYFDRTKDIDAIIHFAALKAVGESMNDPMKYYKNNVIGMINLLDETVRTDINNFVYSSSCTVYGEADELPVTEESPIKKAQSPYGFTKQIGEQMLFDLSKITELQSVILRYFNPTGAHDSCLIGELPTGIPNNLVPYITQTAIGIREVLTVNGNDYDTPDGTNIRDYIHVVDLAKAHVLALKRIVNKKSISNVELFNLGTGQGNSVLEVINAFEEVAGMKLNYRIGPRRTGDVVSIYSDIKKANEVLGWTAERDLKNMILNSWNWEKALRKI
ncbi:MAG: UDP-glucose 4-epimerase GalE [Bacteroidota bacterium]|nr:UDP-glucose 4-epimerase GalE [Bacteroidota bacterium]